MFDIHSKLEPILLKFAQIITNVNKFKKNFKKFRMNTELREN